MLAESEKSLADAAAAAQALVDARLAEAEEALREAKARDDTAAAQALAQHVAFHAQQEEAFLKANPSTQRTLVFCDMCKAWRHVPAHLAPRYARLSFKCVYMGDMGSVDRGWLPEPSTCATPLADGESRDVSELQQSGKRSRIEGGSSPPPAAAGAAAAATGLATAAAAAATGLATAAAAAAATAAPLTPPPKAALVFKCDSSFSTRETFIVFCPSPTCPVDNISSAFQGCAHCIVVSGNGSALHCATHTLARAACKIAVRRYYLNYAVLHPPPSSSPSSTSSSSSSVPSTSLSYLPRTWLEPQPTSFFRSFRFSAELLSPHDGCTAPCTHFPPASAPAHSAGENFRILHVNFKLAAEVDELHLSSGGSTIVLYSKSACGDSSPLGGGVSFPLPASSEALADDATITAFFGDFSSPEIVAVSSPGDGLSTCEATSFSAVLSLGALPRPAAPHDALQCTLRITLSRTSTTAIVHLKGSHSARFCVGGAGAPETDVALYLIPKTPFSICVDTTFVKDISSAAAPCLERLDFPISSTSDFWTSGSLTLNHELPGGAGSISVHLLLCREGFLTPQPFMSAADTAAALSGPVPCPPPMQPCCSSSCLAPPRTLSGTAVVPAPPSLSRSESCMVVGTPVPTALLPAIPACCCPGGQHAPAAACLHSCSCGAPWSTTPQLVHSDATIYTPSQPVLDVSLYQLPCSRPGCLLFLRYDGACDRIFSLNSKIFFSEQLLTNFAKRLYISGASYYSYSEELRNTYRDFCGAPDCSYPSRAQLGAAVRAWTALLSEPHHDCPACGPTPHTLVFDGTAAGIRAGIAKFEEGDMPILSGVLESAGADPSELYFLFGASKAHLALLQSFILPPPHSREGTAWGGAARPATTAQHKGLTVEDLDKLLNAAAQCESACPGLHALHALLMVAREKKVATVGGLFCCPLPLSRLLYPLICPSVCFVAYSPYLTADFFGALLAGADLCTPAARAHRDFMEEHLPFFADFMRDTLSAQLPAYARPACQRLQKLALALAVKEPRYLLSLLPGTPQRAYSLADLDKIAAGPAPAAVGGGGGGGAGAAAGAGAGAGAGAAGAPAAAAAAAAAAKHAASIRDANRWRYTGSPEDVAAAARRGVWYAPGYRWRREMIIEPTIGHNTAAFGFSSCQKDAPEASSHTPGIMTGCCPHGIVYYLCFMRVGEAPREVYNFLRYHCLVPPKLVIYDNACNLLRTAARRALYLIAKIRFLVDRLHWPNHSHCSTAHRMFEYSQYSSYLRNLNSQIMEQLNRLLRRLAPHFQHSLPHRAINSLLLFLKYMTLQRLRALNLQRPPTAQDIQQACELSARTLVEEDSEVIIDCLAEEEEEEGEEEEGEHGMH